MTFCRTARRPAGGTHSTLTLFAPLRTVARHAANQQTRHHSHKTLQFTRNGAASLAAARHPAGGTHSTLTLLAPLWRLFGTVAVQAANQRTRQHGHKTLQFAGKCAKPARSCRLGRGIRQVALTAPSRFLAPLWNCRPGSIRLTSPQTCTNPRNLHDIWPVSFARIACGTPSDKRHSQHPHTFGASWKCRSASRRPADTPPLAQNTDIYIQLCIIARCGTSSGRWHSQHPHAFGASLELSLCRPPTSRHDNTGTKHCNLHANVQNRLAHVACGAASGRWHSQHPHAFWRLFGTAAGAAFD